MPLPKDTNALLELTNPAKKHSEKTDFDTSGKIVQELKQLIQNRPSIALVDLQPDKYYLVQKPGYEGNSAFLFKLDRVDIVHVPIGGGGYTDYRVVSKPSLESNFLPALELTNFGKNINDVRADLRPIVVGIDEPDKYFFTELSQTEFAAVATKATPLINFSTEARYRGGEHFNSSKDAYIAFVALHGLQYTRWSMYEETPDKIADPMKRALRFQEIEQLTQQYKHALITLLQNIDVSIFVDQALKIAQAQERRKHVKLKEHKPHNDVTPLGRYRMQVARTFLGADYKLIDEDMGIQRGDNTVNQLPLFGDPLFLTTLKEINPQVFQQLQTTWQEDPAILATVQQYFPDAAKVLFE